MNAGRIVADFTEIRALLSLLDDLRSSVSDLSARCQAASADLRMVAVAIVDPAPMLRIEWGLAAARDGPTGLVAVEVELVAIRDVLGAALTAYEVADQCLDDAQRQIALHPWLVGDTIKAITTVTGASDSRIAGWLARLYPDGRASVRRVAVADDPDPPRDIEDLLTGLQRRSSISSQWSEAPPAEVAKLPPGFDDGTIDIRRLSGPRGVAWIVELAGTSRWDLPGPAASLPEARDPADFGADLRLMAGESTAYERGVVAAVGSLPVQPGQPILLTGHSEGGMVAVAAAAALARQGLDVRSILTAGSPIATMQPPRNADVLSLENADDIVPLLDGALNPVTPNWTTVRFADQLDSVTGNHGFTAYDEGGEIADTSADPAIMRWRGRAAPFLTARQSRLYAFRIQRVAG